jgi:hypothetical protein
VSGRPKRVGSVTAGAQTYSPAQVGGGPIPEWQIQDAGERAIAHHFGCQRRAPLRSALVADAINYLCDECGARVSVGPDGQPVGPKAPAAETIRSKRSGPGPLPGSSRPELEAIRDGLELDGKPSGYVSIARVAGVSVATVRRRLAGN